VAVGDLEEFLLPMPTVVTLSFVASEAGRAALRDGLEHPPLRRRGHGAIAGQVVRPILADDISDFEVGAGHGCISWRGSRGKVSSGLGIAVSAWGVTCKERLVVCRL
jgi:hypothetical protein